MLSLVNIFSLITGIILFCYFYTLSLIPKKREQKIGEKAWKQSTRFRILAGIFEFVIILNTFLWIWFPVSDLNWKINSNYLIGIGISIVIAVPGFIIMFKGVRDAGSETYKPSDKTKMYGGIYRYIRHPQSLGEFPLFVACGFFVNSWLSF